MDQLRLRKNSIKNRIFSACHFHLANTVVAMVRQANLELFEFLDAKKTDKLCRLSSDRPGVSSSTTPAHSEQEDTTVHCIPESVPLSESEKSLLSKGLNFVPTTTLADSFQNETDIFDFFRRLLLRAYFHAKKSEESSDTELPSLFAKYNKSKSDFTPCASWYPTLQHYIKTCQNQILNLNTKPLKRHNLTLADQSALR